ncbi:MAG: EthD family reductase [Candidatus Micrarchaeaceae archaeon]
MAKLIALYNAPADPAAFQTYYHQTHTPLAKTIPGLRSLVISDGPVNALAGDAPYLVAALTFDSVADLQAAMASPEGKATAADLKNFASGGVTLLVYESKAV